MPKITLDISDEAFKKVRRHVTAAAIARGGIGDIMHALCRRLTSAKDGETVSFKLKREANDATTKEGGE
jgi:hypothetical protein